MTEKLNSEIFISTNDDKIADFQFCASTYLYPRHDLTISGITRNHHQWQRDKHT